MYAVAALHVVAVRRLADARGRARDPPGDGHVVLQPCLVQDSLQQLKDVLERRFLVPNYEHILI